MHSTMSTGAVQSHSRCLSIHDAAWVQLTNRVWIHQAVWLSGNFCGREQAKYAELCQAFRQQLNGQLVDGSQSATNHAFLHTSPVGGQQMPQSPTDCQRKLASMSSLLALDIKDDRLCKMATLPLSCHSKPCFLLQACTVARQAGLAEAFMSWEIPLTRSACLLAA